jgi:large subunit ribosomal protein L5
MNHLRERYQKEVAPALMKSLNLTNVMQVPRIKKVVVNVGVGEALDNPTALEAAKVLQPSNCAKVGQLGLR